MKKGEKRKDDKNRRQRERGKEERRRKGRTRNLHLHIQITIPMSWLNIVLMKTSDKGRTVREKKKFYERERISRGSLTKITISIARDGHPEGYKCFFV